MIHRNWIVLLAAFLLLQTFAPTIQAKKRCKPLLEKLHNIQAMQRSGYSSKRGVSLRTREDKARDTWWQCENGGREKKKSAKKQKHKKTSYQVQSTSKKHKKISVGTPFKTSSAIVIKSQYHGAKKRAWMRFYQQPKRCQRPKSLSEFAFCSEDRQTQRVNFEASFSQGN